ncbi:serine phosphatase RsbU (regulator of sigma subunit) [Streptomyces sp. SAI-133]|uniref:PP2C family protein-serine/threonine phosphatase n=1 Tax=unclassified Streptomyces TaxID=2593676 RepID=UPI00247689D3|nr:GAF domain-containing SpoIIE family protein phosphatase [Streptomyces sp. SAI-133]MDH6589921.1 serine phosphatase RsbU (regulator of sigma subunit) [Streptomyces sp. SAI-133]
MVGKPAPEDRPSSGPSFPALGAEDLDRIQAGLREVAQAHDHMRGLLDAVLAISSALDLNVVLHTVVDTARRLVRARYGALGVLDRSGTFTDLITSGFGADQYRQTGGELPHGTGLLGELVRDPRPLRLDNLAAHPRAEGFPEGHPVMTSLLGVPIQVRDTIYGNLYLADKTDGPFTDADQEIVTALAGAAGIAIENARLYQRLRQATEDFQRRLLPDLPDLDGLELQARYQPSTQAPSIGGDWYDLIHRPDEVPCLMVGDVMGHGPEAAIVMSQISNILRVIAFDEQEPPSRILHRLDDVLHQLHGGPMATVIVARLEPLPEGGRLLRWASAGHLPPLLATPDHQARYLHADTGPPLGVDPGLPRPDHEQPLSAGASLLLHTDGLVEDRRHAIDEGMHQAADTAALHATTPLPQLCDALLAHREEAFHDDVALLAARLTA